MKKILCALLFFPTIFWSTEYSPSLGGKQEDSEMEALRRWFKEKRLVTVKELGGDLSISGEVRVEMQAMKENHNGHSMLSGHTTLSKPEVGWDSEVSVTMDYRSERTWGTIKVKYDNNMGSNGGTVNNIAMDKAYYGGRLVESNTFTLDGEMGRRNLGQVFESKIEFASLYDGALLRLSKASEAIGDFSFVISSFLVNDKRKHYGFLSEISMLRIGNTGFYAKYSVIDWKKHYGAIGNELTAANLKLLYFNYIDSQLIVGYMFTPQKYKKLVKLYLAGLWNHVAKPIDLTDNKRLNYAWYAGFSVGRVVMKGDWAIEVDYQFVEPQAIPDFDCSGIKRGNSLDIGLYTTKTDGSGSATTRATAIGSGNYMGFEINFLYAITNNLTLLNTLKMSHNIKHIGPYINYGQYEMEFNYAF